MPTPRKLPDDETLIQLYHENVPRAQIAQAYDVSPTAVSLQWSRLGLDPKRPRHATLLPWRVRAEDRHAIIPTYLRLLSRLAQGENVPDRRAGSAYRWALKQQLAGKTVHYTDQGWALLPTNDADEKVNLTTSFGKVTVALGSLPITEED